jgi:hypothetical protein
MSINQSIEVTKEQYKRIIPSCNGMVFHKSVDGKYFIKVTRERYLEQVKELL